MHPICKEEGCYMFPKGTEERDACVGACRIQRPHPRVDTGRMSRSFRPNVHFVDPAQERAYNNERGPGVGEAPVSFGIDYRDLELRMIGTVTTGRTQWRKPNMASPPRSDDAFASDILGASPLCTPKPEEERD